MHSMCWKTVIALVIIIIVIGYRMGNIALGNQAKIWNKRSSSSTTPLNTTVVTAFFDIGSFNKGRHAIRNKTVYFKWAETFQYMKNALVVYTDSKQFRNHITAIRNDLSLMTEIHLVNRSSLWSFQNLQKVREIYKLNPFSNYDLNSNALYTCVTHAKFDLLSYTAQNNIFKTIFFMWLDIGYFRHRKSRDMFLMSQPNHFNDLKIAMNQVEDVDESISPNTIIKKGRRSVGGGLIFGKREFVILFAEDFKRAVGYFLSNEIISNEEQIICAMFSAKGKRILKPTVDLQLYRKEEARGKWFYLGNIMVTEENSTRF